MLCFREHPVSQYEFDVLIGADGKRNTLTGETKDPQVVSGLSGSNDPQSCKVCSAALVPISIQSRRLDAPLRLQAEGVSRKAGNRHHS